MTDRTAVYRIYCHDELLYIGASSNPFTRLNGHRSSTDWAKTATRLDVEWFETRAEATEAERAAIASEQPMKNVGDFTTGLAVKAETSTTAGGRVLAAWMEKNGVTRHLLSAVTGVHYTVISRVLDGHRVFPAGAMRKLEKISDGAVPASIWGRPPQEKITAATARARSEAQDIVTAIGVPRIRAGLGVKDRVIQHHVHAGVLPAAWFDFCEKATRRKLDRRLFSFKQEVKE